LPCLVYLDSFFLFLFRKRENGRAGGPSISAAKLPVAGLRRQAATGVENFYPQFSAPVAENLPSAQTMTAALAGAVALSGGCRSSRIRLAERTISAGNTTAPSGW